MMIVKEVLLIHVSAEANKSIPHSSKGDTSNGFTVLESPGRCLSEIINMAKQDQSIYIVDQIQEPQNIICMEAILVHYSLQK